MSEVASGVWTPEAVRRLDRTATEAFGIAGYELMRRAADAVCRAARQRWPHARRWLVLCGSGNNGGDGYVVARLARGAGLDVQVCALTDPARLGGDAATAWRDFVADGGAPVPFSPALVAGADLVVDAILGIGLGRPVAGDLAAVITAVNAAGRPVLAVDVPSGLHAATGLPLGPAIRADLTVTFVGRKLGLYLGAGPDHAGVVEFADLALPDNLGERAGVSGQAPLRLFTASDVARLLPRRPAMAHKGSYGHVLLVGGNQGMGGAIRLAGEAALRAGAGLVTVATRPENAALLPLARPELMASGVTVAADLGPLLERATVLAIGPGLGQDDWSRALLRAVLASARSTGRPLVLDADALNLLETGESAPANWVLTPHPGEAARLLGATSADVQQDRLGALAKLRARRGGTFVLKGNGTLVAGEGGVPWLITTGNPGMATAGMGDTLTGIVAGLLAQFPSAHPTADIAAAAAHVHGAAGDAAARNGQRGLLALELLAELRPWLNP